MWSAVRTAHRVSDPQVQYVSRAIPATIPDRRRRRAILVLVLAAPSAIAASSGSALSTSIATSTGDPSPPVFSGRRSFSAVPAVVVDRGWGSA